MSIDKIFQMDTAQFIENDAQAVPEKAWSSPAGHIKSLSKGLRTLDRLLDQQDLGVGELAADLSVDKSAASRILSTLVDAGFAEQVAGRRYRVGQKLRKLPAAPATPAVYSQSLRERARPALEWLQRTTGETATLAIRADDQVLYLDKVATDMPLRVERPVGTLTLLHLSALGRVFLALQGGPMPKELPGDVQDAALTRLRQQISQIQAIGCSLDDEGVSIGIRCVAAPVFDANDVLVAAIGISGPSVRIPRERMMELVPVVQQAGRLVKG